MNPGSASRPTAFGFNATAAIIALHLTLTAGLGQWWAKLLHFGSVPVYTTEVVLIIAFATGARALRTFYWDRLSRLVVWFVALGVLWASLRGFGTTAAGFKAFSFFAYSMFYFLVRANFPHIEHRRRLLLYMAWSSLIGLSIAFWQMHSGRVFFDYTDFDDPLDALESSTGSTRWLPGEFALYACFALSIVAAPRFLGRPLGITGYLLLAASTIELVFAQHRSGFLAIAAAFCGNAVFLLGTTRVLVGLAKVASVATLGLVFVSFTLGSGYLDETIVRLQHTFDTSEGTASWRLLAWYEVLQGVIDAPLGHGFATWDFLFNISNPLVGSHNSLLDLAYRVGIIGPILLLMMGWHLISRSRTTLQRGHIEDKTIVLATCGMLFSFLTFGSLNMVLEAPYMSVFFWIILAIAANSTEGEGIDTSTPAQSSR